MPRVCVGQGCGVCRVHPTVRVCRGVRERWHELVGGGEPYGGSAVQGLGLT